MKINLKPAFRYQFAEFIKSAAIFYASMIAIMIFAFIHVVNVSVVNFNVNEKIAGSFSGLGITSAIFMFVISVAAIRSQIRLSLQFGVSRRTAFVNHLLCCGLISVILAAAGEILQIVTVALEINHSNFMFADMYQLIYMKTNDTTILTLPQHLNSAFMNFCICLGFTMFGTFFSLLFWLLSRTWKIIAVILMVVLTNLVPFQLNHAGISFMPFINWLNSSPYCLMLFLVLFAAVFTVISWLLLRRTNVKGPTAG